MTRPSATAALLYAAAIAYATLYPLSGWRVPGRWMFAFLAEPWPRYWTGFDVATNVVAYLPLGLLLAGWLGSRASAAAAAAGATLAGALLSLALESLQALLPGRVPSLLDVFSNALGALAGAAVAVALGRGRVRRLFGWLGRAFPLAPRPGPAMLLLAGWLAAQLYPQRMVFATGELAGVLPELAKRLAPFALAPEHAPFAEAAAVAFTVVGVAMIAQDLLARGAPAMPSAVLLVAVAAAIKTWATRPLLAAGPSLWWLSTAAQGGIVAAAVALLLAGWLAPGPRMVVAFASIAAATVLFNLAPPNAYHASMLAQWDPGAWVNFNALVRAVAVVWPFAAMGWCAWRLRALARSPALYNRRA